MRTDTPRTIYLKDYQPYPYKIHHVDLNFDIHEGFTIVTSKLDVRGGPHCTAPMFLNGEGLELLEIKLDGDALVRGQDFTIADDGITLPAPSKHIFTLEIVTRIKPEENTRLEGLYKSGDTYCTQCEAEGFRRITYYPDRPDVMATFTTRIEADRLKYPVLLGNGNRTAHSHMDGGRHYAVWHDPHLKPCYLFALVAGNLNHIHDTFKTHSGRHVDLYIYVRPGDEGQCQHAMESLKKSMTWDEDVYGLEYDLDIFNIVAVSDFNMGAMENKSLNIFNTALVLAHKDTATDGDFGRVESVIAHEYFHNWSGNRVTCRDWFQLSLKEGLTVFRDQEFSSDLSSRAVQRIDDVAHLRRLQFSEDAGPMAHPVRPDNYIEINNFYTTTVYEKGAEVIRMMRTIMGSENYRKGTDLYFARHDGHAVTCDDFVTCMAEASGIDLSHFKLWYSQAGTPEVTFKGEYDAAAKIYRLRFSQSIPDTPGQTGKNPMHIPIAVGLLGHDGKDLIDTQVLHLTKETQEFEIKNVAEKPVPSVLRNFSAPIKLKSDVSDDELAFLMVHDSDGFNRWEAGQNLSLRVLINMIKAGVKIPQSYIDCYGGLLERAADKSSDKALMARAMMIPDVSRIAQEFETVDPEAIYQARETLLNTMLDHHADKLQRLFKDNQESGAYEITPEAMGRRVLRNSALLMLSNRRMNEDAARCAAAYHTATNMTDRMAGLFGMVVMDTADCTAGIEDFYKRYKDFPLVVDKWFSVQAVAPRPDIIARLKNLRQHKEFNIRNPNRVRALYASFAMNNPVFFHKADGSGYEFLCDAIIELNTINPQIAARLLTPLREWRRYTPDRQAKMKAGLERIAKTPNLSPDVFEIVSKTLQ
jgi:aminopeptidase N